MKKSRLLVTGSLLGLAMFTAVPALAQNTDGQTPSPAAEEEEDEAGEEEDDAPILVTGSRISRPTLESAVPLTSVTVDDITGTGEVSLGDALNDLPSLRSTFSAGNSSRFIGTAGLSLLDLRGLGTDRTLVLVNGRRHVTSTPGDNGFDVNTIPIDLVDRIDIVTGGNSAIYGSDAVAGVVNFVMKKDFDGIKLQGQGGLSSRGDRGTYFISALAGTNFADGRGNLTGSFEYTRQQPLYFRQRDTLTGAFSGRCQYNLTEPTAGEPAAGDGIPDQTFVCGVRNSTISNAGTIGALDPASSPTRRYLRFNDAGDIVIDTPTQAFSPFGSTNQIGGLGSTLRDTGSLLAEVDRYAFNVLGHFDVSDAFRPFIEAKYVRVDVSGEGQPSFFTSVPGTLGGPPFRCDNGFLSAQNLSQVRTLGLCTTTVAGTTVPGSAVLRGSPTQTFPLARFNIDFGGRRFEGTRETYRAVAGVEGTFNDDWKYEVAVNYGRFEANGLNRNNLLIFDVDGNPAGFNVAIDSVIAPTGFTGTNFATNSAGQRVICRINAVTNVDPNCVPFNIFGNGVYDQRAFDYSHADSVTTEFASQFVVSAFLGGDLSQLFELPGGPVSFAFGAEYRKEKAQVDYDELTSSGGTFLNALQDFDPPALSVKEAYGEVYFPLLKDMPFAQELSLNLAGRVSKYNKAAGDTGTVYAYNIQGIYAPVEDIRLRGAYATSVRAPTQSDLYTDLSDNFGGVSDPCDVLFIATNSNFATNCALVGVPANFVNTAARAQTLRFLQGGNERLSAEKSRSITVGGVFKPSFVPGLTVTVDYYDIKVRSLIAAPSLQGILNACYGSPLAPAVNPFCSVTDDEDTGLFGRNPDGTFPFYVGQSTSVNYALQRAKGIDFDIDYRKTFDNGDKIRFSVIATRALTLDNFIDLAIPELPNRQLSELGDPQWSGSFVFDYDFGEFDIRYAARYIGKQTIGAYETQNAYTGYCPATGVTPNTGGNNGPAVPCTAGTLVKVAPNNLDAFDRVYYPDALYHDIRIGFDVAEKFRFYAGVNNLLDKQPPLGLLGTAGGDPFDSFGRNFFVGFRADW
ncbi:MAG: TonB-dependent receptor domain-containing protein [Sphingorhabdus sp.]